MGLEDRRALTLTKPFDRLRVRAFTLIELLVVIAIIAILASLLLPALPRINWGHTMRVNFLYGDAHVQTFQQVGVASKVRSHPLLTVR